MRGQPTHPSSQGTKDPVAADAARGTLRDGLGGLRNLVQLLHSLRVAPKSIAQVLPDVYAALGPMRGAVRELLEGLRPAISDTRAVSELEAYFAPRFDELDAAISEAMRQTMSAKTRLGLEQRTSRLLNELDAARSLLDLLTEARIGKKRTLDLLEIVRQGCGPMSSSTTDTQTRVATLSCDPCSFEFAINPRVVVGLVALGMELVVAGHEGPVHIHAGAGKPDGYTVAVSATRGKPDGEEILIATAGLIGPTLACAHATAELSEARLDFDSGERSFTLRWPRASSAIM